MSLKSLSGTVVAHPTTVFHGTAANYVPSFLKSSPKVALQRHTRRAAFCTSLSFNEAARFAIRHTPANDFKSPGVVLEFDARQVSPHQFQAVKDTNTMWNEQEIAFFSTDRLRLVAVWKLLPAGWTRQQPANGH